MSERYRSLSRHNEPPPECLSASESSRGAHPNATYMYAARAAVAGPGRFTFVIVTWKLIIKRNTDGPVRTLQRTVCLFVARSPAQSRPNRSGGGPLAGRRASKSICSYLKEPIGSGAPGTKRGRAEGEAAKQVEEDGGRRLG